MRFPCDKCGACCRNVGKQITLARELAKHTNSPLLEEMLAFPYNYDENGVCEKLVDNQCSVYDSRPDVCNVRLVWKKHLQGSMKLSEWYEMNQKACKGFANGQHS